MATSCQSGLSMLLPTNSNELLSVSEAELKDLQTNCSLNNTSTDICHCTCGNERQLTLDKLRVIESLDDFQSNIASRNSHASCKPESGFETLPTEWRRMTASDSMETLTGAEVAVIAGKSNSYFNDCPETITPFERSSVASFIRGRKSTSNRQVHSLSEQLAALPMIHSAVSSRAPYVQRASAPVLSTHQPTNQQHISNLPQQLQTDNIATVACSNADDIASDTLQAKKTALVCDSDISIGSNSRLELSETSDQLKGNCHVETVSSADSAISSTDSLAFTGSNACLSDTPSTRPVTSNHDFIREQLSLWFQNYNLELNSEQNCDVESSNNSDENQQVTDNQNELTDDNVSSDSGRASLLENSERISLVRQSPGRRKSSGISGIKTERIERIDPVEVSSVMDILTSNGQMLNMYTSNVQAIGLLMYCFILFLSR